MTVEVNGNPKRINKLGNTIGHKNPLRKRGEYMATYKVNHSGLYIGKDKDGKTTEYRYEKDVPVELPDDAVQALGDAVKPVSALDKVLNKMVPGSTPK